MTFAGLKKCVPSTSCGRFVDGGDLVHVERRGVGGEDRARLRDPVEVGEDALLEVHLLEHRLDDEVGILEGLEVGRAGDERDAAVALLLRQPAAGDRAGVVLPDRRKPAVERVLRGLDDRHRDAGIGEVHGDAAAHGAGADDAAFADLARLHAGRHVRHLLGLALGEEDVALGARFLARQELHEQLELARLALAERLVEAVAHGFDAGRDRAESPRALRRGVSRAGEARRVGACRRETILAIAHAGERALLGDDLAGEGDRLLGDVAGDDRIDDAVLLQLLDRRRGAGEDELERPFRPDEARQALRAAGAGQETELDLGQADAGAGRRDAVMAAERELEAAAERRAVQRRDDRLADALDRLDDLDQPGRAARLAELRDVGAGREGAPGAGEHRGLNAGVVPDPLEGLDQPGPDLVLQGIDGRVVDGDDGDLAVMGKIDARIDASHVPSRFLICRSASPGPSPLSSS